MTETGKDGKEQPWPESSQLVHVQHGRHRHYRSSLFTQDLPGATTVIKAALGLSTEPLVSWAAKVEREACLEAAESVYGVTGPETPVAKFVQRVKDRLGETRQHQKLLDRAADLGSAAHDMIRWTLTQELGQDPGAKPTLSEPSLRAYSAFQEYWRQAGLKAVRMEQPIYDLDWGFAGTIDIVVEHPERGMGVIDIKTSKAVYGEHHVQVASYLKAGRNFADLKWGEVVRLPKTAGDGFEVVQLGKLYDREVSEAGLLAVFRAALVVFNILVVKEEA